MSTCNMLTPESNMCDTTHVVAVFPSCSKSVADGRSQCLDNARRYVTFTSKKSRGVLTVYSLEYQELITPSVTVKTLVSAGERDNVYTNFLS